MSYYLCLSPSGRGRGDVFFRTVRGCHVRGGERAVQGLKKKKKKNIQTVCGGQERELVCNIAAQVVKSGNKSRPFYAGRRQTPRL